MTNRSILAAGQGFDIGAPVVLWNRRGGFVCPNKRGRQGLTHHDPALNDQPTRADSLYSIEDPPGAYRELKRRVHQLVLHYDVCYCSFHCHQLMRASSYKGSHFYLDLDGTLYQTCDLYWKTNTAPADDRKGNDRAVHVEISNLSSEALEEESEIYPVTGDQYKRRRGRWELLLPEAYRNKIRTPGFRAFAARSYGNRGYFSRRVNGKIIRMWDFTDEQYETLIRLCVGIHQLLPGIELRVPQDPETGRTPFGKIKNFAPFAGVLGHAHVQAGTADGVTPKYDPGPAFDWARLRRAFSKNQRNSGRKNRSIGR